MRKRSFYLLALILAVISINYSVSAQSIGIFEGQGDVGNVKPKGNATYNATTQQYTLTSSGANIWGTTDAFHYLWRKIKGDFILRANVRFIAHPGAADNRKLGLMIRSGLDAGAKYVDVARHGNNKSAIQYRLKDNDSTRQIESKVLGADVIQLERRGNVYTMSVAKQGDPFTNDIFTTDEIGDDVYVGIFLCAHNDKAVEKAIFSNVRIVVPAKPDFKPYTDYIGSNIEILDLANKNSRVIYQYNKSIQAPNWTRDGKKLLYNQDDLLYTYDLATNKPTLLNTGDVKRNNNDHVISFDGKMLAISSFGVRGGPDNGRSIGYVVPITGGIPKRITTVAPSYIHSWSPDGKSIVFMSTRDGNSDIYRVSPDGGLETRLTTDPAYDDGCEFTPDGKYIYFNSVRSGHMQIWRMKPDGSEQTQITHSDFNDWFPHVSPDGKFIVYISFLQTEVKPDDHPFYKHVYLQRMPINGGKPEVIAYLYGGQGTINTPSFSPDSKKIAFVSNTDLLFPIFPIEYQKK
ncbi:SMP-30/gluconolactonase/LRE family protein [Mucilaginibacter puniceus]